MNAFYYRQDNKREKSRHNFNGDEPCIAWIRNMQLNGFRWKWHVGFPRLNEHRIEGTQLQYLMQTDWYPIFSPLSLSGSCLDSRLPCYHDCYVGQWIVRQEIIPFAREIRMAISWRVWTQVLYFVLVFVIYLSVVHSVCLFALIWPSRLTGR